MGKGRILVSFLDTPNDHILFCLCVGLRARCVEIMRDEVRQ